MQLITINEAAATAGKSIQTIRRMIKQRKIQVKKQKTPQGFNYLVIKESLLAAAQRNEEMPMQNDILVQDMAREHRSLTDQISELFKNEVGKFNMTMQHLIEQHKSDKDNFFGLIKTFQDRVLMLENQIKLLESPKHRWWQFWKK